MFYQYLSSNQSSKTWADVSFFGDSSDTNHEPLFVFLEFLTYLVFIPIVSLLGIFGNSVSILILYKRGLHKSSNILILSLAVADSIYLVGINNIPLKIYLDVHFHFGFYYTECVSMLLYVTFHTFVLLETVGKVVSMILPPLIIVERFTAVFFPLHFSSILTPFRIKAAVAVLFPLGLPAYFYYLPMTKYTYTLDIYYNITVGYILKSDSFDQDSKNFSLASEIYSTFCGPMCVGFVIVGCVLISIKIHLQVKKRELLSQPRNDVNQRCKRNGVDLKRSENLKRDSTIQIENVNDVCRRTEETARSHTYLGAKNALEKTQTRRVKPKRTTKILLSVCIVYSITGSFNFFSDMVLNSQRLGNLMGSIFHWMSIIALCINSAANFLIYVALNKNFRNMYRQMFCWCNDSPNAIQRV